jgi:peptidoglycan/LPS O-acetylase OafA/YrhL
LNCLFNGPAAVVIFFIVSGFFIHLPQTRKNSELNIRRFYIRRAIRIGIPALFAVAAYEAFGYLKLSEINQTVLWSIICEAIYYVLYPGLLVLGRKHGWISVVLISYAIALVLCLTNLQALRASGNSYVALGWLTWIVGLPCWILGCWLAENRQRFKPVKSRQIWLARAAIFAIAFLLRIAKFHSHSVLFSNCFTLNAFALPVTAWIGIELASSARLGTSSVLEWVGKWSYSLYLVHPIAYAILALAGISEINGSERYHLIRIASALVFSYCFYLAIEKPAHRLAILASRRKPVVLPAE